MEEFLGNLYSSNTAPVISAMLLGLMTAISPCPLLTNITAIGFISKDLENRHRVFYNGLIYTMGRVVSYVGLAFVIYIGADQLKISMLFQQYGEKFIGPVLILFGLFMLGLIRVRFPGINRLSNKFGNKTKYNFLDVLILGIVFALAFCPYSGVLYFGMLMPLTIESDYGLYLPVVFAVATGIPVIIFAWLLAFTVSGVGNMYNALKRFEIWFRRIIAILFIGVGIYYIIINWL